MTLDGKAYGVAAAICNHSPLLAPLDVSIAALREGLSLNAPVTQHARWQAMQSYYRLKARLDAAGDRLNHRT